MGLECFDGLPHVPLQLSAHPLTPLGLSHHPLPPQSPLVSKARPVVEGPVKAQLTDHSQQALTRVDEGGGGGLEDRLLCEGAGVEEGVGEGGGGERDRLEGGGESGVGQSLPVVFHSIDFLHLADDCGGGRDELLKGGRDEVEELLDLGLEARGGVTRRRRGRRGGGGGGRRSA